MQKARFVRAFVLSGAPCGAESAYSAVNTGEELSALLVDF
jgi:hypothetical protein